MPSRHSRRPGRAGPNTSSGLIHSPASFCTDSPSFRFLYASPEGLVRIARFVTQGNLNHVACLVIRRMSDPRFWILDSILGRGEHCLAVHNFGSGFRV